MNKAIEIAMRNFRAQPILCAETKQINGFELLARHRLNFNDPQEMLKIDIEGIAVASMLAHLFKGAMRIHCNAEITSMQTSEWMTAMVENICPGVVVELVERNERLYQQYRMASVSNTIRWMRRMGGMIALDDWTGTPVEMRMVEEMQPEIIKVNEPDALTLANSYFSTESTAIVVERIESHEEAKNARHCGATELQGYWCDLLVEHDVPAPFTPPGVMARLQLSSLPQQLAA